MASAIKVLPACLGSRMQLSEMEKLSKTWLGILLMTLLGAVALGVFESMLSQDDGYLVVSLSYIAAMLILNIGIAIHELGHLLAGAALGLHCRSVLIGPLQWIREKDRWIFSLTNNAHIGGLVTFDPYRSDIFKKKYLVMYAAGPVASLIFALALTPIVFWLEFPGAVLWELTQMITLAFIWLMVINFIPMRVSGFGTDGYWMWAILTNNKTAQTFAVINRIMTDAKEGINDDTWSEDDVRMLRETESPVNIVVLARVLLFWHAWSKRDQAQAREYIIESLIEFPKLKGNIPGLSHTVYATAAFSAAMIDGEVETVKEFLGEIDQSPPEGKSLLIQIDAWIAMKEGREEDVLGLAEKSVRNIVVVHPGNTTVAWHHVDNYRYVSEAAFLRALATAESFIGPAPIVQPPVITDTSPTSMN